jgi:hypothetical protein
LGRSARQYIPAGHPIYYISLDPEIFDFINYVNFRHGNDISETFHMAGTKLGIFSFNLRYYFRWLSRCRGKPPSISYHTILKFADHALSKMVRYVLLAQWFDAVVRRVPLFFSNFYFILTFNFNIYNDVFEQKKGI